MKILLILLLCTSAVAHEHLTYGGAVPTWKTDKPILWSNEMGPEYTQVIKDCFQAWSDATDGLLRFEEGGENIVLMIRNININNASGLMNARFLTEGFKHFIRNDVWIAPQTIFRGGDFLRSVLLHEIGHALGVAHSNLNNEPYRCINVDSPTMGAFLTSSNVNTTLHLSDINCVRNLYGLEERQPVELKLTVSKVKRKKIFSITSETSASAVILLTHATFVTEKGVKDKNLILTDEGFVKINNVAYFRYVRYAVVEVFENGNRGVIVVGKPPKNFSSY